MNCIEYFNNNDIFWCYLQLDSNYKGGKPTNKNCYSTNGLPVVSTFELSSIRNARNLKVLKDKNINTQEEYIKGLKKSQKYPSKVIVYDTSNIACLDIDTEECLDKLKNLKGIIPYLESISRKMPHFFIKFHNDKKRISYPPGIDWLTGQYSFCYAKAKVINFEQQIPEWSPEKLHDIYFPSIPLETNNNNKNNKVIPQKDHRYLDQKLIKNVIDSIIVAGKGKELKDRDDWLKWGSYVKFYIKRKPKKLFKDIARTADGWELEKIKKSEWDSFQRVADERFLINKLKKYNYDKECKRLYPMLIREYQRAEESSDSDFSSSDEEEEEELDSTTENKPVNLSELLSLCSQLKYNVVYKKYKQIKEDILSLKRYENEIESVKNKILKIISGTVVLLQGGKPTLITLYYDEHGLIKKYSIHPTIMDCRNNWIRTKVTTFDLDSLKKKTFDPIKVIYDGESDFAFKCYSSMDCCPCEIFNYNANSNNNILNIWCGWSHYPFEKEFEVNLDLIKPILRHIRVVMANDKFNKTAGRELFHYVICWLKQVLKGHKNRSQLYFHGAMGIGKNLFTDWFAHMVIGPKCSESFRDLSIIDKEFNSLGATCSFIIFNEVPNHATNKSMASAMKDMVTNSYQNVTRKYCEAVKMRDNKSYVYTSNYPDGIAVEGKRDRRNVIIQCNPKYQGNTKYFNKLRKILGVKNNGKWDYDNPKAKLVAKHFTEWLIRYDDSNFNPENIPKTFHRVRQQENSTPYNCRFLKCFFINIRDYLNIPETEKVKKLYTPQIFEAWTEYNHKTTWGAYKKSFDTALGGSNYSTFMKWIYKAESISHISLNQLKKKSREGRGYWAISKDAANEIIDELDNVHSFNEDDDGIELECIHIN